MVCCSELRCVAVCCGVLRCVAMYCSGSLAAVGSRKEYSVLQCVVVHYSGLHGDVVHCCSVLSLSTRKILCIRCIAVCCSVLQCVAVCCSVLQCLAACCSVLQCLAVSCSVLQCVAVLAVCCSVL